MVNLVVRHGSHLQGSTLPRAKSPAVTARHPSPKPRERSVPSPIRVPYHRQDARPVSPLTTSESMFGTVQGVDAALGHATPSSSRPRKMSPLISREESGSDGELVCDYDKNVTPLYELLESSQWEKARLRCRTHPEEVQTWIVRRDTASKIRWKLLPLHAAVIFQAPSAVIQCLLKEHPLAAGKRDDQGMLPLHLAFRHKQEESLLEMLLEQYPQAISGKDRRDRLPIDHGKDSQFSAKLLQSYAVVYAKCHPSGVVDEAKPSYESQMATLKAMYEERMEALAEEHEKSIRNMKVQIERDQHVVRTQHDQEMDELRDLLSREVASGQRATQLEMEVQELRDALHQSKEEAQLLQTLLHDQKSYQEDLKDQLRKVLGDQKSLHAFCTQQQEQLEQAQQLREQLLRSLLQKEDGKAVRVSREISQLSNKIVSTTEQIVARSPGSSGEGLDGGAAASQPMIEKLEQHGLSESFAEQGTPRGWGAHSHDHGDDISAITENSNY